VKLHSNPLPSDLLDSTLESMVVRLEDGSYSCGNCGKVMASKKDLKRHAETHMNGCHQCHICHKVSKTRSGLATHFTLFHKDQVASPWSMKPC